MRSGSAAVDHSQRYLQARNNYKQNQAQVQSNELAVHGVSGPTTPS